MKSLRQWRLGAAHPLALQLAADARLSQTDYLDDQSWEVVLGVGDAPAVSFQTRYGGRVGLASLVPMWTINHRPIYQARSLHQPPIISAFTPGYCAVAAQITAELACSLTFRIFDSHTAGGNIMLDYAGDKPLSLQFDWVGFVAVDEHERKLTPGSDAVGRATLKLSQIGNIQPVLTLDSAAAPSESRSRIGAHIQLEPHSQWHTRWMHVGLAEHKKSVARAEHFLTRPWDAFDEAVERAAAQLPQIETGDEHLDAAVAFSLHQTVQAFLRPEATMRHAGLVETRQPGRGFSSEPSAHPRTWLEQDPFTAYTVGLAAASINADMAQGMVENYLDAQLKDGWIDAFRRWDGQQTGLLCPPLLARLAWGIYQYTEDAAFLERVLPGLTRFFDRWFAKDRDQDSDHLPEWQHERQRGLPSVFDDDLSKVETPDLAAYLLSEAISLREIAHVLGHQETAAEAERAVDTLKTGLEGLWNAELGRYCYRDRDTHRAAPSVTLLTDALADEAHEIALALAEPARVVIEVTGGSERKPDFALVIRGRGSSGQPVMERSRPEQIQWRYSRGRYTSLHVFSEISHIHAENLLSVYRLHARTTNTAQIDMSALLPLWAVEIPPHHAQAVIELLHDQTQFVRPFGVTPLPSESRFADAEFPIGTRTVWHTLLIEGLIEAGAFELAAALLRRSFAAPMRALQTHKAFFSAYHPDTGEPLGERGSVAGILPLHALMRVLGVRVISPTRVWTGGTFSWGSPVVVRHRGVTVKRSADGTQVAFPSGQIVELAADSPWQSLDDRLDDRIEVI